MVGEKQNELREGRANRISQETEQEVREEERHQEGLQKFGLNEWKRWKCHQLRRKTVCGGG